MALWNTILLTLLATSLTACGALRSYDRELDSAVNALSHGRPDAALAILEKNNAGGDKDLLYFLEKGSILRLNNDLFVSTDAWNRADHMVQQWEEAVQLDGEKFFGHVGSAVLSDRTRKYEGYDYEKVMLTTELALNHLLTGDWEQARIEIKKTHEREAVIAEFRAKEAAKNTPPTGERNISFKDLNGYPVELLEDPEVVSLNNSYQSAFSHYLAGFIYEALEEPGLAAPGYRQAIELRPHLPILEDALDQLEKRLRQSRNRGKPKPAKTGKSQEPATDVLFVVESGFAPARETFSVHLPIPVGNRLIISSFTVPVIRASGQRPPAQLTLDSGPTVTLTPVTSINAMSRRALRDEMPGILLRNILRAATKGAMQSSVQDRNGLLGVAMALASVLTEGADERTWRTLPADISIGRAPVAPGSYNLGLGRTQKPVTISGKHQVVFLRQIGHNFYKVESAPPTSSP